MASWKCPVCGDEVFAKTNGQELEMLRDLHEALRCKGLPGQESK